MTREEAKEWSKKYISRNARTSHVDYDEFLRRTHYVVDRLYNGFEDEIKILKDLRNNSVLISQEDVDFLQLQNQQYADTVSELESTIESQEIMLSDMRKRIDELEYDNKELSKDFTHSKYVDKYKELEAPKTCCGCKYEDRPDDYWLCCMCSRNVSDKYEPKDDNES